MGRRELLALFLFFSFLTSIREGEAVSLSFSDESTFPSWAKEAIRIVKQEGIMSGFGDGTFRPNQKLTRAEAVTLLIRAKKDIEKRYNGFSRFPDVPSGAWFEEAVGIAASNGWVKGRPDGRFYPGDNLTRAEFAVLVARAFNLRPENMDQVKFEDFDSDAWYSEAVAALYEKGLLRNARNRYFRPEHIVTRAEAAWTFALIAKRPGINGAVGEVRYEKKGYNDSRRVAIKPRDFNPNKQGYETERRALYVDVNLPVKKVEITKDTTDWQHLGDIRIRNTLDYRANLEFLQLFLRFDRSGAGPANAFDIKLSGFGFEGIQQIYKNGEVSFTGMNQSLHPGDERVFSVEIRRNPGTSYFKKEAVGNLFVKGISGKAFKSARSMNIKASTVVTNAPVEYKERNLLKFTFRP